MVTQDSARPPRRKTRWMLDIVLVVGALILLHWLQTRSLPSGEAPPLTGLLTATGQPVDLAGMRGRPVLVHFRSTWCSVCRLEEGSIASIAEDYRVLAVAWHSGAPDQVEAYLRNQGIALPGLADPDGKLGATWSIRGVPSSFILDEAGKIRFVEVGYTTELGLRARLWAGTLL